MTKLVVDEPLRTKLVGLTVPVELCDPSGRTLGHFVPQNVSGLPHPSDECPYSEEELLQMQQETGGRPLAEIWKDLGRE